MRLDANHCRHFVQFRGRMMLVNVARLSLNIYRNIQLFGRQTDSQGAGGWTDDFLKQARVRGTRGRERFRRRDMHIRITLPFWSLLLVDLSTLLYDHPRAATTSNKSFPSQQSQLVCFAACDWEAQKESSQEQAKKKRIICTTVVVWDHNLHWCIMCAHLGKIKNDHNVQNLCLKPIANKSHTCWI